ncbi:MAG: hypothetical protein LLG93_12200 [Deltaproteobacteria bacterium]|nr:hypothetical protein [Deltaproteobacteria bacterium]
MLKLNTLLSNRNVIFLLALALGLLVPAAVPFSRHLILPVLAVAMAIATMEVDNGVFLRPRALIFPAFMGIVMSYIVLGNIIIALSALLINDEALWTGSVLLAAVPPAVAVIPFSGFLRGNSPLSLFGTVGAYLGALVIMPLIAMGLLSGMAFDPCKLVMITLELIVLPLAVSRLLIREGLKAKIDPYRSAVTNWCFFIALYTMIGLNRDIILGQTRILVPLIGIAIVTMFLLGFVIDWVTDLFHIEKETRTSLVLLGTLKNQGLAGGLALTLFSQEAALPAAVSTIVMIVYIIWLDFKKRWD